MSRRRWRRSRSRSRSLEPGTNATEIRLVLPKPERDPYFNRTAGADQVPPPIEGRETSAVAVEDEPDIARDYRWRREMITLERAFKLAGKLGLAIGAGFVVVLGLWSGIVIQDGGILYGFQPENEHGRIALFGFQLTLIAMTGIFGWACRGLVRGDRQARLIFTIEAILSIFGCLVNQNDPELLVVVLPSAMLVLLLLWRPRGRRYFSDAYKELVDRTPAVTVLRETGRGLATMFLTSLLVIQFANGYWISRILHLT